ncbi:MAG: hypothetical protein V3T22_02655 [Planctomycetota bacterium]
MYNGGEASPGLLALAGLLAALACACGSAETATLERREVKASQASKPVLPGADHARRFGRGSALAPSPTADAGTHYDYDLPAGWEELPTTSMRLVNLRPAGDPGAECSLIFLTGDGGGLVANVNRWRGQMGLGELDAAGVNALPTRALLGTGASWVDLEGAYAGMGGEGRAGWALLGLVGHGDRDGVHYLKFTGPADLVNRERENFELFLTSLSQHTGAHGETGSAPAAGDSTTAGGLRWTAPEGWQQEGARSMRLVSFRVAQATECYVTLLAGDGGGLVPNLNRWRTQLGGAPLTPAELDALPTVNILGQDCPVLEVSGDFTGMEGPTRAGQGLLGTVCIRSVGALFVKMVGPTAEIEVERERFMAFAQSLEEG